MPYCEKNMMKISGGIPLYGTVKVQGSKNAVLPLMAASILIEGRTIIHNCPEITDVFYMKKLLQSIGCNIIECIENDGSRSLSIDATTVTEYRFPNEYVERMRSSVVLLGPVLARMKQVILKRPGGCTIGERPIDLHLMALKALGAELVEKEDTIYGKVTAVSEAATIAEKAASGRTEIVFPKISVGATENAILYAVCATGNTLLVNASGEPEILELCAFLNKAGAKIDIEQRADGCNISIQGVERLKPIVYENVTDRIVAGTYAFAVLAAGGCIAIKEAPVSYMKSTLDVIARMGATVMVTDMKKCSEYLEKGTLTITSDGRPVSIAYIETAVYPGFPTDMQSAFLVASCVASGKTILTEKIFENRFKILSELKRMGARITLHKEEKEQFVEIEGVEILQGCNVLAKELRGGAALVLAGLCASGITTVGNIHFIQRGYENMERDLKRLHARVSLANECD